MAGSQNVCNIEYGSLSGSLRTLSPVSHTSGRTLASPRIEISSDYDVTRGQTPPGARSSALEEWLSAAQVRVSEGGSRRASYNPLSAARLLEVPHAGNEVDRRRRSLDSFQSFLPYPSSGYFPGVVDTIHEDDPSPMVPLDGLPLNGRAHWSNRGAGSGGDSTGSGPSQAEAAIGHELGLSASVTDRVKDLARQFSERTERFKERSLQQDSPASVHPAAGEDPAAAPAPPAAPPGPPEAIDTRRLLGIGRFKFRLPHCIYKLQPAGTIDTSGAFYICWLFLVSAAFMYNAYAAPLRTAFFRSPIYENQQSNNPLFLLNAFRPDKSSSPSNPCGSTTAFSNQSAPSNLSSNFGVFVDDNVTGNKTDWYRSSAGLTNLTVGLGADNLLGNVTSIINDDLYYNATDGSENASFGYLASTFNASSSAMAANPNISLSWSQNSTPPPNQMPELESIGYNQYVFSSMAYSNSTLTTVANATQTVDPCLNTGASNGDWPIIGYFPGYETPENRYYWWALDYICDLIYILDIVLVKSRLQFIKHGMLETNRREAFLHYRSKVDFKLDLLALVPFEIFYLIPAVNFCSLLRLNRLLKIKSIWEFFDRVDQRISAAYIARVIRTMLYLLYLIHLQACGYFVISALVGIGSDGWVYDGTGTAYVHSMYLATKTAASIGNNWQPNTQAEYMFITFYWLLGIFLFAMLIGQIRDIFHAMDASLDHYRRTIDQTMYYMKSMKVPREVRHRVKQWFTYNWQYSKTLDENSLLEALPLKMRSDLAISVHYPTLSKVSLFQDCEKNLLLNLVLKLKPVLYLPGDYICRKGEVGTEMYIVKMGHVEVVGGPNNSVVFVTLKEGSVFGEISLLAIAGSNRRTADVRAKGYAQLFLLSKADFEEAMRDYPDAHKLLKKKAKNVLSKNAKPAEVAVEKEEIIKSRQATPKLFRTLVKVVSEESNPASYRHVRKLISSSSSSSSCMRHATSQAEGHTGGQANSRRASLANTQQPSRLANKNAQDERSLFENENNLVALGNECQRVQEKSLNGVLGGSNRGDIENGSRVSLRVTSYETGREQDVGTIMNVKESWTNERDLCEEILIVEETEYKIGRSKPAPANNSLVEDDASDSHSSFDSDHHNDHDSISSDIASILDTPTKVSDSPATSLATGSLRNPSNVAYHHVPAPTTVSARKLHTASKSKSIEDQVSADKQATVKALLKKNKSDGHVQKKQTQGYRHSDFKEIFDIKKNSKAKKNSGAGKNPGVFASWKFEGEVSVAEMRSRMAIAKRVDVVPLASLKMGDQVGGVDLTARRPSWAYMDEDTDVELNPHSDNF